MIFSLFLGPTIFEILQPKWNHYCTWLTSWDLNFESSSFFKAYFMSSYRTYSQTPDPSLKTSAKQTSPASRIWSFKSCQLPVWGKPEIQNTYYEFWRPLSLGFIQRIFNANKNPTLTLYQVKENGHRSKYAAANSISLSMVTYMGLGTRCYGKYISTVYLIKYRRACGSQNLE